MRRLVLLTNDGNKFESLVQGLTAKADLSVDLISSVSEAQERLTRAAPDLMIVDETVDGLSNIEIARRMIMANAMVNLILVSALAAEDFHDKAEGLGILAQLPSHPDEKDASRLMEVM